mgnify:CR=1 FL=1
MSRMRTVTEAEVEELADWVGVEFAPDEAADAADRIGALAPIYRDLEAAPIESLTGDAPGTHVFETTPHRPTADEDPYNAWITRFDLVREGAMGVLDGMDVALKDNMAVRGVELTCGSAAFADVVPGANAAVANRLLDAGARIVGKTNMDELAFGPTSETSAFGPTPNPADTDHVAGGSSSGSAAAVAAEEVDLALGSDTGGSVRIPASYCGIVGIKPTYGLVPRTGFGALAYSMDHIGPFARDVETAARGLAVLADGPPGSGPVDYHRDLGCDLADVTVGVVDRFFETHVSDGVERSVRAAIDDLADAGATVESVAIPELAYSREAWWGIATPEFAAEYAGDGTELWRRGPVEPTLAAAQRRVRRASSRAFGTNVKEMLALGAHLLETHGGYHYVRARNLRAAITTAFDDALEGIDVIAAPSTPTTALELGGFDRGTTAPVNWDTHPTNLTGHPSVSLPCGEAGGLPVGFQLMASWYDEQRLLDVAHEYERIA